MNIKVSEIEGEIVLRGEMEGTICAEITGEELHFHSPVVYDLVVVKFDEKVRIRGSVKCVLNLSCARCLEEFLLPVEGSLDIKLSPRGSAPSGGEFELKARDLDVDYYDGDEIELAPLLCEEVYLDIPTRPLCAEECKGLCDVCGKNRNVEECGCSKASATVLEEKLKTFLKQ
jgi:uncharacterized protein